MRIGIIGLAFCLAVSAVAGQAQESSAPPAFQDFSAKRVKPPKPGTTKRITIQIEPRANPAVPPPPVTQQVVATAVAPAGTPEMPTSQYGWYWSTVSPKLEDSGPGRLLPAVLALSKGPGGQAVAAPRLSLLQEIADAHGRSLLLNTVGTQVSPALALAVIAVESSGRVDALSGAGAQGLMQLMPDTATRFGVTDSMNPEQNIKGGIAFLNFLMEKFDGDPILVLAGYNAGENSIGKNNGVPPYPETRDYVPKVLAAFEVARGLCITRPELISDPCVLHMK